MKDEYTSSLIKTKYKYPINIRGTKSDHLEYFKVSFNNLFRGDINFLDSIHTIPLVKRESEIKHIFTNEIVKDLKINPQLKYWGLNFLEFYNPEIVYLFESIIINSFAQLFFPKHSQGSKCNYNYLFEESRNQVYRDTIKIKISPQEMKEIKTIKAINLLLSNNDILKIRFDGNKKFTLEEILIFYKMLDSNFRSKIEYFEEPCQTLEESIEFFKITDMMLGIDESFELDSIGFFKKISDLSRFTLVLRPSLYGISQSKIIIDQFAEIGIPTIISSTYETEDQILGLLYLANYSDFRNRIKLFHGLDPVNAIPSTGVNYRVIENKIEIRLVDSRY